MVKFKKGDICKVIKDTLLLQKGDIVIVKEDNSAIPFVSIIKGSYANDTTAPYQGSLELLQGQELEDFLVEFPEYRKEPIIKVEKDDYGNVVHVKIERNDYDPTDIMNVKKWDIVDYKGVMPERVIEVFNDYLLLANGEWNTKESLKEAGWKIQVLETTTYNGKKYDKKAFEEAISNLIEL